MAGRSVDLVARLIADASKFKAGMAEATLSAKKGDQMLRSMGRGMDDLGGNLTRKVALPIAAIGAAAVKTFTDFDTELTKIGTQVRGTTEGLSALGDAIKGVSKETGQAPAELAKAMFTIESSGLKGAAAMDALNASAKGAAIGLGDAQSLAKVGAAAFTLYQDTGLKASDAIDVLMATVREGNLSAEELAGSISQVLPVAAKAGVELSEVGASVALLTRGGASASEAVTQMRAAILQLNAPTAEAAELLAKAGISTDELRSVLADGGVVDAFELLNKKFGDQPELLRKVIGSSEGLNAVLGITSAKAKDVQDVFSSTADSAGVIQKGFDQVSETAGFKFQKAMNDARLALIDLGDTLAPIASGGAEFLSKLTSGFESLPDSVKTGALAFAGFAAALGPVLSVSGKLVSNVGTLRSGIVGLATGTTSGGTAVGTFARALGSAGVAAVAAGGALAYWNKLMDDARGKAAAMVTDLKTGFDAMEPPAQFEALPGLLQGLTFDMGKMREEIDALGGGGRIDRALNAEAIAQLEEQIKLGGQWSGELTTMAAKASGLAAQTGITTDQAWKLVSAQKALGLEATPAEKALESLNDELSPEKMNEVAAAMGLSASQASVLEEATYGAAGAAGNHADETNRQRISLEELNTALNAQFDPLFGMLDAVQGNKDAMDAYNTALAEHGAGSAEATAAQQALTKSALDVTSAQIELRKAVKQGDVQLDSAKGQLMSWAAQGLITGEAAAGMAGELDKAAWSAGALDKQSVHVPVKTDAAAARAELDNFQAGMAARAAILQTQGAIMGAQLTAGLSSGISAGAAAAARAAEATVSAVVNAARAAAGIRSPSKVMADEVGKPMAEGVAKGMSDAEKMLAAAARNLADAAVTAAEGALASAENRLGNAWDRITGRFSIEDSRSALRQAEAELERATSGAGVRSARAGGRRDAREIMRDSAQEIAEARRAVQQARRQRNAIDKQINPWAWRDANAEVAEAQRAARQAMRARTAGLSQNERETAREVAQARRDARRDARSARDAVQSAAFDLLQQSEGMVGRGQLDEFRALARQAGLKKPEIGNLISSIKGVGAARSELGDIRGAIRLHPDDVDALAQAIRNLDLDVVVKLDGKVLDSGQRRRERAVR